MTNACKVVQVKLSSSAARIRQQHKRFRPCLKGCYFGFYGLLLHNGENGGSEWGLKATWNR